MSAFTKLFTCGAVTTLLAAVVLGFLLSGTARKLGVVSMLFKDTKLYGMCPVLTEEQDQWGYTWDRFEGVDLRGQTALVTGANAGIGFSISRKLAEQGAVVYMACRNPTKCAAASARIIGTTIPLTIDTSSLESVRRFATDSFLPRVDKLDMLFMNAGIGWTTPLENWSLPTTTDGIELMFATNVVGHHLLYRLIAPKLAASSVARVVLTSSVASYSSYDYGVATDLTLLSHPKSKILFNVYGQTKLAQVLWAQELTRQLQEDNTSHIFVNSFHPGAVATEIWSKTKLPGLVKRFLDSTAEDFMWSSDDGALTGLYLGVHIGLMDKTVRGKYFHPQSQEMVPSHHARDEELQRRVWAFLDDLTNQHVVAVA